MAGRVRAVAPAAVCAAAVLAATFVHLPRAAAGERGGADPCRALDLGTSRYEPGKARHVVFAVAPAYGTTEVAITECARKGLRWRKVLATSGYAGRNGFAAPGTKREGDGKSPTGAYTLTEAFGERDPGTALPYRTLRESGDCWGSTIGDARYNRYYRGTCLPADENLSRLMRDGPYKQAVVIDHNRAPVVPGAGSAIFMHVTTGRPTAGCVSLPRPELETVMRTLRPHDRIIMGPREALFRTRTA
ncbi:L,D-transpeptidase family protein [Spirillospora sp. NPDC029432]|uniref:L,D-transpeptidase family protein n=1 Tax=Spirillospora sp. NPDC029432 TaxID=3154599 RepID=UPI00345442A6